MNNLNSVLIEGNLTREPVSSTTPNGKRYCKFTIASNRYFKAGDETQQEVAFVGVETWGRVAKSCATYLEKGRGVRVIGRLKQERWTDQDGKNHERILLSAEHVEFKPQINHSDQTKSLLTVPDPDESEVPAPAFAGELAEEVKPTKKGRKK